MTEAQLKKLTKETLGWADELSERWTNTTTGNIIDYQSKHLRGLLEYGDMNLVSVAVLELAQTLDKVESDDNGH
jgi:hypothetical protein